MKVGILLSPGFLEAESALAMEVCRLLGWEVFTVARGRTSLEGAAGSAWTPKYTFVARPELEVLVIPGGANMSKLGRDEQHQDWLNQNWEGLRAVFCGANAVLFLLEAGRLSGQVVSHAVADKALAATSLSKATGAFHWNGKTCTTGGYLHLVEAMLEWAGFADETKRHLGM